MNSGEELGARMRSFGLVLRGRLDETRWRDFLMALCKAISMAPAGEPAVWSYPLHGKGGTGQTIMLPITESFLVVDTWSDHDGAYLFVCSCREFAMGRVLDVADEFGLKAQTDHDGAFFHQLRLK